MYLSLNKPEQTSIVFVSGVWFICHFGLGKISLEDGPALFQRLAFSKFSASFDYIMFEHFILIKKNSLRNKRQLFFNRYVQARPLINQH